MGSQLMSIYIKIVFTACITFMNAEEKIIDSGECGSFSAVSTADDLVDDRIRDISPLQHNIGGIASLHHSAVDLGYTTYMCNAILISRYYLLTAANCMVDNGDKRITTISLGRNNLNENPGSNTYQIERLFIHPDYGSGSSKYHNVAILKTERPIIYTHNIWPLCLMERESFADYLNVEVSGWTQADPLTLATSSKETASINIVENSRCTALWKQHATQIFEDILKLAYPRGLTRAIICAGQPGVDVCDIQSGGPMYYQTKNGEYVAVGIIINSIYCSHGYTVPELYTNIGHYIDWIRDVTGLPPASTTSTIQTDPLHPGHFNNQTNVNQCGLTAKQLMTTASGGTATRGIFISLHNKNLLKIRRQSLEVQDDIILLGPELPVTFFSREFEEKSSSNEFLKVADTFGMKVAAEANYEGLFVEAKGGVTLNYDKEESTVRNTKTSSKYVSAIECHNVPIKSIELDPSYIRLNSVVLKELKELEKKIYNSDNQNGIFKEYFENFGSHYIIGLYEFGGTLFVKAEASFSGSSSFEVYKETVKRSVYAYAELSISGIGGSIKTNAEELKDKISGNNNDEILKKISLERQQRGGPPEDNYESWKRGLAEQCDTWSIINKPTELITTWDLIMLHYSTTNYFQNATSFTGHMKKAWEAIIHEETSVLIPARFEKLGISSTTLRKRKQLLMDMLSQDPVYGVKNFTKYARVSVITSGSVVMSALEEKEVDHDTNSLLLFDSITFLPERPYKVYLRLHHNQLPLGDIIIVLDGQYPKRAQQFLQLSTGNNNVGGSWRGAGFNAGVGIPGQPGEYIGCNYYMTASGLRDALLFPVEKENPEKEAKEREVRAWYDGGTAGFWIITKSAPGTTTDGPIIGHIHSGIDILKAVVARGDDFVKAITFTNCGLVVID